MKVLPEKLFAAIDRYSGDPSSFREWLAAELNCSERTLKRELPKHVELGNLVETRSGDRQRCKNYALTDKAKHVLANPPKIGRHTRSLMEDAKWRANGGGRPPSELELIARFAKDPEFFESLLDLAQHIYDRAQPLPHKRLSSGDKTTRIVARFEAQCRTFLKDAMLTKYDPNYHSFYEPHLRRYERYGADVMDAIESTRSCNQLAPCSAASLATLRSFAGVDEL